MGGTIYCTYDGQLDFSSYREATEHNKTAVFQIYTKHPMSEQLAKVLKGLFLNGSKNADTVHMAGFSPPIGLKLVIYFPSCTVTVIQPELTQKPWRGRSPN